MDYRREIDGLRAFAVTPVILFHAGFELFSGGYVGVDVFFVISGYLITTIILFELQQDRFSLLTFYERRARRILPALFLILLICVPFAWFLLLPGDMKEFSKSLIAVSLFASNILFWRESGYFDTTAELKPLLHTWSLAVEEQFYVFFPIFLMLFWRLGKRWLLYLVVAAFVSSLCLAQWASLAKPAAAFYLLPTRGWELLIGAISAFYLTKVNRKIFSKKLSEIGGWTGVVLILVALFSFNKQTPFPGIYALVPTVGAVLIIIFATQQTTAGRFMGNQAFVGLGLISYSAYLWHQPLFAFARHKGVSDSNAFVFACLTITAIILAYLSWRYVERPFRSTGNFNRGRIFIYALFGSALVMLFGYQGYISNGFDSRYEKILDGDLGHMEFHQYIDKKFFDCEPDLIAREALRWEGYLRCKQSKKGAPEIVLLGDSHAEHLFLGLAEHMPTRNIAFYILNSKPYIDNPEFTTIYKELLHNSKPQHVILTMHYILRLNNRGDGLYDGFSSTIKALKGAGKTVSLVGDIPLYKKDSAYCAYIISTNFSSCVLSIDQVNQQKDLYRPILQRLSAEYGLFYTDIDLPLCDQDGCKMTNERSVLYRDNNHLNIIGSRMIGEFLADKLSL